MKVIVGKRQTGKTYNLIQRANQYDKCIILVKDNNSAKNLIDQIKNVNIVALTHDDIKIFDKEGHLPVHFILVMTFWEFASHAPIRYTYPLLIDDIVGFTKFVMNKFGITVQYGTIQYEDCEFIENKTNCKN